MSLEACPRSVAWDRVRLRLREGGEALLALPVILHQDAYARRVDHTIRIDAKAVHGAVVLGDAARAEQPRQHVHRLGRVAHEVEDPVRLLTERHRVRLEGVDHVGELDRVANEEHREVVAHQIPVAVLGLELHSEPPRVARGLRRVAAADDGREA
jgi:hypothetical protein